MIIFGSSINSNCILIEPYYLLDHSWSPVAEEKFIEILIVDTDCILTHHFTCIKYPERKNWEAVKMMELVASLLWSAPHLCH